MAMIGPFFAGVQVTESITSNSLVVLLSELGSTKRE